MGGFPTKTPRLQTCSASSGWFSPYWSPTLIPHEVVALSLVQLVHWGQVVEHTPERLDGLHHAYLTQVGKEVAGGASFWGAGERQEGGGEGGGRGGGGRRRRKRRRGGRKRRRGKEEEEEEERGEEDCELSYQGQGYMYKVGWGNLGIER